MEALALLELCNDLQLRFFYRNSIGLYVIAKSVDDSRELFKILCCLYLLYKA